MIIVETLTDLRDRVADHTEHWGSPEECAAATDAVVALYQQRMRERGLAWGCALDEIMATVTEDEFNEVCGAAVKRYNAQNA